MSLLTHITRLYDYTYTAHRMVWDTTILPLTDEQFTRPLPYSIGSIHHQVVHTMSAEWIWFSRLRGNSPTAMLSPADYPTRDAIRAKWDGIESEVRAYLASLSEADLLRPFDYALTNGTPDSQTVADILLHVANHGTDHRAQLLAQAHALGGQTIAQDYLFYLRRR